MNAVTQEAGISTLLDSDSERRNVQSFWAIKWLMYVSAPVLYVDVVQAGLLDKLGVSKTLANLPASAYFMGAVAPLLATWLVPSPGHAKRVVVVSTLATAATLAVVFLALVLPLSSPLRILVVVAQGLMIGLLAYTQQTFLWHCLAGGTGTVARARALRLAYTFGPIFAVGGSLGTQFLLAGGVSFLPFPYDFASLYFAGTVAMVASTLLATRFRLPPQTLVEQRPPFREHMLGGARDFIRDSGLGLLWIALLLWYITLGGAANLSLYARDAVGREPKELSGLMMALRFGAKCGAGSLFATLLLHRGPRAALLTAVGFLALAFAWVFFAPGYAYLLAFALIGAGELGGAYFNVYGMAVSQPERVARNLSFLALTGLVSSVGPVLHGALTDVLGFGASFTLGLTAGVLSLLLILCLPSGQSKTANHA